MYYEYNNIKIYYEEFLGHTKNIVILPGWGNTRNTFYNIINYFKNEYNIYIFDYPGFGNSPIPSKELTIYDYADIIRKFLIDKKIDNPIIIAHSFGGRIAVILNGILNIHIDKMIFMDTAGIKPKKKLKGFIKEKIYKILKFIIIKIFKKTHDKKIKKLRKLFASNDYNNLPESMHNTFKNIINEDLKNHYKKITSEVLLIWGKKDIDTPYKDCIFMNKNIKNSDIVSFKDGGHFTYLEYIYNINLIIKSFIKEK